MAGGSGSGPRARRSWRSSRCGRRWGRRPHRRVARVPRRAAPGSRWRATYFYHAAQERAPSPPGIQRSGRAPFLAPAPITRCSSRRIFTSYPINLLWLGLAERREFIAHTVLQFHHTLHYALAGAFAYAYGRQLGIGRVPAMVAGAAFMFSGFLLGHLHHWTIVDTIVWLPAVLAAILRTDATGRVRWAVATGLALGIAFLAGHPQIFRRRGPGSARPRRHIARPAPGSGAAVAPAGAERRRGGADRVRDLGRPAPPDLGDGPRVASRWARLRLEDLPVVASGLSSPAPDALGPPDCRRMARGSVGVLPLPRAAHARSRRIRAGAALGLARRFPRSPGARRAPPGVRRSLRALPSRVRPAAGSSAVPDTRPESRAGELRPGHARRPGRRRAPPRAAVGGPPEDDAPASVRGCRGNRPRLPAHPVVTPLSRLVDVREPGRPVRPDGLDARGRDARRRVARTG